MTAAARPGKLALDTIGNTSEVETVAPRFAHICGHVDCAMEGMGYILLTK